MSIGSFLFECAAHHTDRVQAIVVLGEQVWSCSSSGAILVHDKRGEKVLDLRVPSRGLTLDYATCMAVVEGREVWCGLSSGGVCVYRDGLLMEEMPDGHKGPVSAIAWSERTKTVWTGGGDFAIIGWSATEKKRNAGEPLKGHTDWVRCLLVCNGRLWSGSDDKTIRMWPETGAKVAAAVVELHRGGVLCLARVGDAVWSGGADRQICRFDLSGSEKGAPLTAHKGRVTALVACGGRSVWSGSSDRHCIVWSMATQRILSEVDDFGGAVGAIAAVDGWCVWTGTGDGRLRCWMGGDRPPEEKEEMEEMRVTPPPPPPPVTLASGERGDTPVLPSPRVTIAFSEEDDEDEAAAKEQRQARRKLLQKPRVSMSPIRKAARDDKQTLFSEEGGHATQSFLQSPKGNDGDERRTQFVTPQYHTPAPQHGSTPQPQQQHLQQPPQQQYQQPQPPVFVQQQLPPVYQPSFSQPSYYQPLPPPSYYQPPSAPQQPQTIIIAPASPAQPQQQQQNNDALVSHLRENYQQLRSAYLTLQEKHELLRDQQHRQLVQIEENHRRELDHLRREMGLEMEGLRRQLAASSSNNNNSNGHYPPANSMVVRQSAGPSFEEMRMLNESIRRRISDAIGK